MNEDFSEVINKFKNILEEKDIDFSKFKKPENDTTTESIPVESPLGFNFDIETILKLKNLISSAQSKNSPRVQLLQALKPFLHESKQQKLDEYMKIANILTILEIMNENRR